MAMPRLTVDEDLAALDLERLLQGPDEALGRGRCASAHRDDVLADDDELVSAEAADGVAGPDGWLGAVRPPSDEETSPAAWPRLSLTSLNRSRSRNRTATLFPSADRPGQRLLEAVEEKAAVGQPGERVVEGVVGERRFGLDPLGEVPDAGGDQGAVLGPQRAEIDLHGELGAVPRSAINSRPRPIARPVASAA